MKSTREVRRKIYTHGSTCSAKNNQPVIVARENAKKNLHDLSVKVGSLVTMSGIASAWRCFIKLIVGHTAYSAEHDLDCLLRKFEHDTPLNAPSVEVNFITNISSSKGKNACIDHVWGKNAHVGMSYRQMRFRISFSKKLGHAEDALYQMIGQFFGEITSNPNSLQTKRFVRDSTKEPLSSNSLSRTSRRSMEMSSLFCTDSLMLLNDRSFS